MDTKMQKLIIRLVTTITTIGMITVNALANALPVNGVNTGQVSDAYGNLFAPAGLTFAIWGVIYLLLVLYTLYQFGLFQDKSKPMADALILQIGVLFSVSSLANIGWIFAWHYDNIILSMILMLVILVCLAVISRLVATRVTSRRDRYFVAIPFGVYFGWITVATIANATTLLVYAGWDRFGISEQLWTILILVIGTLIGSATIIRNKDIAYGLVLLWAYSGILIKHLSASGFAGQYPEIYAVVMICLILQVIAIIQPIKKVKARNNLATF